MRLIFHRNSKESIHSGIESVNESFQSEIDPLNGDSGESEEMAVASKEKLQDNASSSVTSSASSSTSSGDSIFTIIYSLVKKVTVVGAIYFVGYMGWSVAWLITPIVLAVTREYWRHTSDLRRTIAKASATANEKDVILARIKDLPAWVYFPDVERCEWINRVSCSGEYNEFN